MTAVAMATADLEAQRDELVGTLQAIDDRLRTRKAQLGVVREQCYARRARAEWLAAKSEDADWRVDEVRHKLTIIERLKAINDELKARRMADAEHNIGQRLYRLRAAVAAHRDSTLADYEPTAADLALWETLDAGEPADHR